MNKAQTKIDAERYVAPAMNEHVLSLHRNVLAESYTLEYFGEEQEL